MNRRMKKRFGVAAVETAVCLPLVFLVVFGAIEIASGISQQHKVRSTAHETARVLLRGPATLSDGQAICAELLEQQDFPPEFTATLEILPRGGPDTNVNIDSVREDVDDVGANFPVVFDDTSAPSTPINVPRGTILRLSITTPRPTFGKLIPAILPPTVEATAVFVKGL